MVTSIGARPGINNPGNLTVTKPNQILYPGQTGTFTSPNGLTYATFPDAAAGSNALHSYITSNVGSGTGSLNNLTQFANYYLNGESQDLDNPIKATAANPYPAAYLSQLQKATGLGPTDPIQPSDYLNLMKGIATAEGTKSVLDTSQLRGSGGSPGTTPFPPSPAT